MGELTLDTHSLHVALNLRFATSVAPLHAILGVSVFISWAVLVYILSVYKL